MQKWEYLRVYKRAQSPINPIEYEINGKRDMFESPWEMLNYMGNHGWELVDTLVEQGTTKGYLFKRPK